MKYCPLLLFFLIVFPSCKTWSPDHYKTTSIKLKENKLDNNSLEEVYLSYKDKLDKEMKVKVASLANTLTKQKPESSLGNHAAEITFTQTEQYLNQRIDFAIVNYGGLRVPLIDQGALMVEDAFELMPFDNYLVLMELDGATTTLLFNHMAQQGGWPIHNASYVIKDGHAESIRINNKPLNLNNTYKVALSDYLANGGDNCSFLREMPYTNTAVFFRDAIIAFWKAQEKQNRSVTARIDGRVINKDE